MTPITDWAQLPLVLHTDHMAALYDVRVSTIWKWCQRRTLPEPLHGWGAKSAYAWYRDAVRLEMETPRSKLRGKTFARVARVKAELAQSA